MIPMIAAATLVLAQQDEPWVAYQDHWYQAPRIQPGDWTTELEADGVLMMWRPRRPSGLLPIRYEFEDPVASGIGSFEAMTEVDCEAQRLRTHEATGYASNNLQGERTHYQPEPGPWVAGSSGPLEQRIVDLVCGTGPVMPPT